MNLDEKKYDAFISYRHCELDQYVAVTLHRELESFKIPKNMYKQLDEKGIKKRKIERVFRDRDELPITNNLADPIVNALQNSEFLLVICTPRLKESIWCKTEVDNFIAMHGREHVFAILAEGEPEESFPQQLLYDDDGKPIEPLAADVRGADKREIHKKIKEEVIRLAAPMFELSYDDLKQRHREQKIRKIITSSIAATIVFGTFAVVSTFMALRISSQSKEIEEQKTKIEQQYEEAMYRNASAMATESLELAEEGYVDDAVKMSLLAVTGTEEEPMPSNADALNALASNLRAYRIGIVSEPSKVFEMGGDVQSVKVNTDSTKLAAADISGYLRIWDIASSELIYEDSLEESLSIDDVMCWLDKDRIVLQSKDGCVVKNITTGESVDIVNIKTDSSIPVDCAKVSPNGKYLAIGFYDSFEVFDAATLERVNAMPLSQDYYCSSYIEFSEDESHVGFAAYSIINDDTQVAIYDIDADKCAWCEKSYEYVTSLCYADDRLIVFSNKQDGYDAVMCTMDAVLPTGEVVYSKITGDSIVTKARVNNTGDKDYIVYVTYSDLTVLDASDYSEYGETSYDSEITRVGFSRDGEFYQIITRNGTCSMYSPETGMSFDQSDARNFGSNNIEDALFINDGIISYSYSDDKIKLISPSVSETVREATGISGYVYETVINEEDGMIAAYMLDSDMKITIFSLSDYSIMAEYVIDNMPEDMCWNGSNVMVATNKDVIEIDVAKDEVKPVCDISDFVNRMFADGVCFADANSIYIVSDSDGLIHYDLKEKKAELITDTVYTTYIDNNICADSKCTYVAYMTEDGVNVVSGDKVVASIKTSVKLIESMIIDDDGYLYLSYLDNHVERYKADSGELVNSYKNVGTANKVTILSKEGKTILGCDRYGYVLDKSGDIEATIEEYMDYVPSKNELLSTYNKNLYTMKLLDRAALIDMAKSR